jgi:hypothetical protein
MTIDLDRMLCEWIGFVWLRIGINATALEHFGCIKGEHFLDYLSS